MIFQRSRRQATGKAGIRRDSAESSSWGTVRFIVTLIVLAWAIRSFIVAPFSIPSGSMLPTLYVGDYLLVAKWPYGYSKYSFPLEVPAFDGRIFGRQPARGDVVVFRHPDGQSDLIKRVIGVPGDTIEVKGGAVTLNGKALRRQAIAPVRIAISANSPCKTVPPMTPKVENKAGQAFCLFPAYRESLPDGQSYVTLDQVGEGEADNFGPVTVPAGRVFLMGDNRDDSLDSRYDAYNGGIGMVPNDHLIGRALVTFWSTDGSANYINPLSWIGALRGTRLGSRYSDEWQ
jgi:signal peptidase I